MIIRNVNVVALWLDGWFNGTLGESRV